MQITLVRPRGFRRRLCGWLFHAFISSRQKVDLKLPMNPAESTPESGHERASFAPLDFITEKVTALSGGSSCLANRHSDSPHHRHSRSLLIYFDPLKTILRCIDRHIRSRPVTSRCRVAVLFSYSERQCGVCWPLGSKPDSSLSS
jgi:hypothetical protein